MYRGANATLVQQLTKAQKFAGLLLPFWQKLVCKKQFGPVVPIHMPPSYGSSGKSGAYVSTHWCCEWQWSTLYTSALGCRMIEDLRNSHGTSHAAIGVVPETHICKAVSKLPIFQPIPSEFEFPVKVQILPPQYLLHIV
jgi:hypothetical protein